MNKEKKTQTENVVCVYEDGVLIALVKRDMKSGKRLIYTVAEADTEEIVMLINPDHTLI